MNDSFALYLVILLVYLSDCVATAPRNATVFRAWWRDRFRRFDARDLPGTAGNGWVLLNPLPPLGTYFRCTPGRPAPGEGSPRDRLDVEKVRARLRDFREASRVLRVLCGVLVVHVLFVVPLGILYRDINVTWKPLLAVAFGLVGAIVAVYVRARRRLYGRTRSPWLSEIVVMVVAPPAAARAIDALSRDLMEPFDPLAVIRVLGPEDAFLKAARQALYDARSPEAPSGASETSPARPAEAARGATPPGASTEKELRRWLEQLGVDSAVLCRPPSAEGLSWCPRCGEPHTVAEGDCSECPGVRLLPTGV